MRNIKKSLKWKSEKMEKLIKIINCKTPNQIFHKEKPMVEKIESRTAEKNYKWKI